MTPAATPVPERLARAKRKAHEALAELHAARCAAAEEACPFSPGDVVKLKGSRATWVVRSVLPHPLKAWKMMVTDFTPKSGLGKGETAFYERKRDGEPAEYRLVGRLAEDGSVEKI